MTSGRIHTVFPLVISGIVLVIHAMMLPAFAYQSQKTTPTERKQQVVDLLKSIETGDARPAGVINPSKYIQHNLAVADGIEGFAAMLQQLPPHSARVHTVRVFADGDFVFAHTEYDFFGPKIGFDVFRFEDNRIVEHWDNLQETPQHTNPSGRTMIDGSTDVSDLEKTDVNKTLVRRFVDDILVEGRMEHLATYFNGDHYIQHNPLIGDGLSGLRQALDAWAQQGVTMTYDTVHKVLGEGNFVLVMSEGTFSGTPTAFYDLFRIEDGKIAEHWDTIETIPSKEQWKNNNGKF